jgi:putative thioredoxin
MSQLFVNPYQQAPLAAPTAAAGNDAWVQDGNTQNFMPLVVEASVKHPVVVLFWSARSELCKKLIASLEPLIMAAKGQLSLVKISIDQYPQIAQQLQVQSVPTVYAFLNGQPVDGFAGALPDHQLKQFVQNLSGGAQLSVQDPTAGWLEDAQQALQENRLPQAKAGFEQILQLDPANLPAIAGLGRVLLATGNVAAVETLLAKLPPELAQHAALQPLVVGLALVKESAALGGAGSAESYQQALATNPADHAAALALARLRFVRGELKEACDLLLASIAQDAGWQDGAARQLLLRLFDALGFEHPVALSGRRQLSALLFR